ncbi:hypothetical protein CK203_054622 [Vitis vinifera]|uniref:Retrovirus-related Pol polyprotein from transposon RE1 n=1 Tax=Vitis vinifera TaxID=29760 RepID=A0A438GRM4_VITVI|nr:hypothetical protein CK203_054622 [Vitis vinifera]
MVISPLSQLITMRLEDDNFLMWKYQIKNVVRGYGLEVQRLPTPRSSVDFLASIFNLKCVIALGYVLQSQMQMLKKDGLTMRDYLTKMKNYCDLLATAGHKIFRHRYILAIMQGLGDEYESVMAVISSKKSSPSLQYVTSTLIAHEGRIAHKISSNDLSVNYTSQYSNREEEVVAELKEESSLSVNYPINLVILFIIAFIGSGARNGASGSISSAGNVNLTEYDAQEDQDCSEMVATPKDLQNCCWFPDSGATNHVTHDLGNPQFWC